MEGGFRGLRVEDDKKRVQVDNKKIEKEGGREKGVRPGEREREKGVSLGERDISTYF